MGPELATEPRACRETCGISCGGAPATGASPAPPRRPRLRPRLRAGERPEQRRARPRESRRQALPRERGRGSSAASAIRQGAGPGGPRAPTPDELNSLQGSGRGARSAPGRAHSPSHLGSCGPGPRSALFASPGLGPALEKDVISA